MKITIHLIILFIMSGMVSTKVNASTNPNPSGSNNDFEVLMQKIRIDFAKNPSIDEALKKYNEADGSFTDVDYGSIQRTNWPPWNTSTAYTISYSHIPIRVTNIIRTKISSPKYNKGWNTGTSAIPGAITGGTIK